MEIALTLRDLQDRIRQFTQERNWDQYHTPVNVARNLIIEINELTDLFVWFDGFTRQQEQLANKQKLYAHELADVLYNLLLLDKSTGQHLPANITISELQQANAEPFADLKEGTDTLLFGATQALKNLKEAKGIEKESLLTLIKIVFRLGNALNIDLGPTFIEKMHLNAEKYPVSKCYGKSIKYSDL